MDNHNIMEDKNTNQIEGGKVSTNKTRKILLIVLAVLLVLVIIFYFAFGNSKTEINEYKGAKDLSYIEQIIENSRKGKNRKEKNQEKGLFGKLFKK